jgi:hypothetical protein
MADTKQLRQVSKLRSTVPSQNNTSQNIGWRPIFGRRPITFISCSFHKKTQVKYRTVSHNRTPSSYIHFTKKHKSNIGRCPIIGRRPPTFIPWPFTHTFSHIQKRRTNRPILSYFGQGFGTVRCRTNRPILSYFGHVFGTVRCRTVSLIHIQIGRSVRYDRPIVVWSLRFESWADRTERLDASYVGR